MKSSEGGFDSWCFQMTVLLGHEVTFIKEDGVNVKAICEGAGETFNMRGIR